MTEKMSVDWRLSMVSQDLKESFVEGDIRRTLPKVNMV